MKQIIPDSNSKIKLIECEVKNIVQHASFNVTKRYGGFLVKFRSNTIVSSEEQINTFIESAQEHHSWECTNHNDTAVLIMIIVK